MFSSDDSVLQATTAINQICEENLNNPVTSTPVAITEETPVVETEIPVETETPVITPTP
jgi:hypothetical protein